MDTREIDAALRRTLDDGRFTRAEADALDRLLTDMDGTVEEHRVLRSRVFAIARESAGSDATAGLVGWIEDAVKVLARRFENAEDGAHAAAGDPGPRAIFSPGDDCRNALIGHIRGSRATLDVCVFTISDDRISEALWDAHHRGVRTRIVSDNDKAHDRGSDVHRLAERGVPVAFDASDHHMHHKFAIFDERAIATGSYNWTRSAARSNQENLVVATDAGLVRAFGGEFDRLWKRFARR